jgi:preprotein translocase subunit SecG|tara:strand:- start:602 stop:928 length:327 start_codon:yes stop_codon:yes gene_type:complete
MQLIFLVIQIILAVAIVGSVLLQKNGGDGLGNLGGGSGISGGSIVSSRTTAGFLSKATMVLMFAFMVNSLVLGNLSVRDHTQKSVVEKVHNEKNAIKKQAAPQVPVSE